ncbi:MAG: hypothetical protein ACE15C_19915 [Phycisphaerae bacterium]
MIADDMLFIMGQGELYLYDINENGYKELAVARIPYDTKGENYGVMSWSPMAISKGRLVLRLGSELVCLQVKAGADASSMPATMRR